MNLSEAERQLGLNREYLKGRAEGLGIQLDTVGRQRVMTAAEFERLKAALKKSPRRRPQPSGA